MTRSLILLAVFTAAIIVGAYVCNIKALDFLAFIFGIVFLIKCCGAINAEREEKEERAQAERELQEEGDEGDG